MNDCSLSSKPKNFWDKLIGIDDTPHNIASGFAVGVFLGILPGLGPIAALFVSTVFKMNKVAALLGSLLTNTWLSIVTFVGSIKIGSLLIGTDWQEAQQHIKAVIKNSEWKNFLDVSFLDILKPLIIGYFVISLAAALLSYLGVILFLNSVKRLTR